MRIHIHNIIKRARPLAAAVLAVSLSAVPPAYANSVSDLQNQLDRSRQEERDASGALAETREEKSAAQAEVDKLDEELAVLTDEVNAITDQLEKVTAEYNQAELDLARATGERETQYEVFKERMRVMYMNGEVGYLEVIFSAGDFSDFWSRLDYIGMIAEYDEGVLNRLKEIEAGIQENLLTIERLKTETEILKDSLDQKHAELEVQYANRVARLKELESNEQFQAQRVRDEQQTQARVAALIKQKQAEEERRRAAAAAAAARASTASAPAVYNGGVVGWPLPGYSRLSSEYSYREGPFSGRREFHTGLDIPAPTGTPIAAAEAGTVIFSGTMGGYGRCVIVDHKNGMSTLYGHASRLDVSEGQSVARGQTIARVGSTGNSTGPHLHFETRIGGVHKNPWNYLK